MLIEIKTVNKILKDLNPIYFDNFKSSISKQYNVLVEENGNN